MTSQAGIVVIGNEVLSGKVTDVNSTYLIAELRALGVTVGRVSIIPDELEVIETEVREHARRFDVVFTTGGVGPTHDDKTFAGVARAFGVELERNAELEGAIRAFFGPEAHESYFRLSLVPRGTELLWSEGLPFPVTRMRNVYVMPGDPTVLRKKFAGIRETFRRQPFHLRRIFTRLDEGALSMLMSAVDDADPEVEIGSYPVYGHPDYQVQITIESKSAEAVARAESRLRDGIPDEAIWKIE